jgi:hypothetical protein
MHAEVDHERLDVVSGNASGKARNAQVEGRGDSVISYSQAKEASLAITMKFNTKSWWRGIAITRDKGSIDFVVQVFVSEDNKVETDLPYTENGVPIYIERRSDTHAGTKPPAPDESEELLDELVQLKCAVRDLLAEYDKFRGGTFRYCYGNSSLESLDTHWGNLARLVGEKWEKKR